MAADTGRPPPVDGIRFYRAAGWDDAAIDRYKGKFGSFGEQIYPLPSSYRRLLPGESLRIGAHHWQVVIGSGHSPEHACLYCAELKLLISGDQVLPLISSNVSVYPTEPDANPLHNWLTSLSSIAEQIPDDVLVLPAHNSPFLGLHARIAHLIDGHRRGLERLEQALSTPLRVIDTFPLLFSRPISLGLIGMASGESLAHLNYLVGLGKANRETDGAGVHWWRRV
jgi:glyoxylase-like metal-dependent hydrolase (beta-lactamase superfamily II)